MTSCLCLSFCLSLFFSLSFFADVANKALYTTFVEVTDIALVTKVTSCLHKRRTTGYQNKQNIKTHKIQKLWRAHCLLWNDSGSSFVPGTA